ncbi:hypothetical protein BKA57DRAFT_305419 [Linnemannia elongata]|nr:hypothetical protein BKA57DRAFT_305419 [Linnemannia elongata]
MAFLNKVSLDCIAADPYSRYLYGIGSASDIQMADDPVSSAYMNPYLVLVKSNASPTNLSTVSWTVVSRVRGNDYSYSYPTFTSVDCATNGRGDFTAFFRSPYRTVSPAKLLPMGLRYSPDSGSWTAIQGTSLHGWTSEECFHKSFYTHPESPDVFHLLTTLEPYQLTFGRLDSTRNLLFPESSLIWGENGGFIQPGAGEARFNLNPYDYTKRGFFTPIEVVGPAIMAFHRDTFYFIGSYTKRFNITCPSITTSLSTMGRLGNSCTFQSPPEEEIQDGDIIQNYIFGGDRNGTTFFGGIYKINNVTRGFLSLFAQRSLVSLPFSLPCAYCVYGTTYKMFFLSPSVMVLTL